MNGIVGYFDGSWNQKKGIGMGCVVEDDCGKTVTTLSMAIDRRSEIASANVAEYMALILLMRHIIEVLKSNSLPIMIYGDSQLIINQVLGEYKVRKPHLRVLRDKVLELMDEFKDIKIKYIPRKYNKADPYSKIGGLYEGTENIHGV